MKVSNFSTGKMTDLTLIPEIKPAINQIELHPYHQQCLQRETAEHFNIAVEACSTFNQGKDGIFNDPTLNTIAQKYEQSIPQVILRWQTQLEIITIPKSTHIERIKENYDIFDFQLTHEKFKK
ncbi:aldo/keto reductase [Enterococcus hailinensis]|uniref:aldo/keto reductase n=1 Tax=Enterococcus hailinensis TaxID=3238988 RepID=UPI0038B231AF